MTIGNFISVSAIEMNAQIGSTTTNATRQRFSGHSSAAHHTYAMPIASTAGSARRGLFSQSNADVPKELA